MVNRSGCSSVAGEVLDPDSGLESEPGPDCDPGSDTGERFEPHDAPQSHAIITMHTTRVASMNIDPS